MKKFRLTFVGMRLLSLENCQMRPQNIFSQFFSENSAFFEKIVE